MGVTNTANRDKATPRALTFYSDHTRGCPDLLPRYECVYLREPLDGTRAFLSTPRATPQRENCQQVRKSFAATSTSGAEGTSVQQAISHTNCARYQPETFQMPLRRKPVISTSDDSCESGIGMEITARTTNATTAELNGRSIYVEM